MSFQASTDPFKYISFRAFVVCAHGCQQTPNVPLKTQVERHDSDRASAKSSGKALRAALRGFGATRFLGFLLMGIWCAGISILPVEARPNIVSKERNYREIGTYDEKLSKLCASKRFNQVSQLRYSAYFAKDRILLGGARGSGWNLNDPTRARKYHLDYWFRNDGFSNCEVYTVRSKRPPRGPQTPLKP